jgi:hypothetical protein
VSKTFIENGKKMDVKIKNNSEALELWKGRIAETVTAGEQLLMEQKKISNSDKNKVL